MWNDSTRSSFFSRSLKRQWVLLIVAIMMGFLAAGAYLATESPRYSSTSIVFLEPLAGNPYSPATPPSRAEQLAALTTEAGLVYTDSVIRAAQDIGSTHGVRLDSGVRDGTFTEVPSNSQVVRITYTHNNPQFAQAGSQSLAEAYLQYRRDRASRVVETQTELRNEQQVSITTLLDTASSALDAARVTSARQASVLDLEQQVTLYANQLAQVKLEQTAAEATSIFPGDIISPAVLPTGRDGVDPLLVGGGIVFLAVGLGILLALIRAHLDHKVRDESDIADAGIEPLLGSVRSLGVGHRSTAAVEDYRKLHSVLHAHVSLPSSTILLAGVSENTSSWDVASGLAEASDEAGTSVTLMLAAPGAPCPDPNAPGLTDMLSGDCSPMAARKLLQPVSGNVSVLGIGTRPDLLPSLVQGGGLERILDELGNGSELVLITGPSANSATGAVLARLSGKVLLVVAEGRTTSDEIRSATALLDQEQVRVIGSVLLRQSPGKPKRRSASRPTSSGDESFHSRPPVASHRTPALSEPALSDPTRP